ncbi:hypothetical protein A3197_09790 [Candidatus Thiodiazotropha endoloripes]|nr:hypothetical protein A3197_09790 [Candidatus Thiodiazotropha endoloripes]
MKWQVLQATQLEHSNLTADPVKASLLFDLLSIRFAIGLVMLKHILKTILLQQNKAKTQKT